MQKVIFFKYVLLATAIGVVSCNKSEDNPQPEPPVVSTPKFVLSVSTGTAREVLANGSTLYVLESDLSEHQTLPKLYKNDKGLHNGDYFTQVSYNSKSKTYVGHIYPAGAAVLGSGGARSFEISGTTVKEIGEPVKYANVGNSGIFGDYSYAARISADNITQIARNGNTISGNTVELNLANHEKQGIVPSGILGLADFGDNKVAMALNYAGADFVGVALADYNLGISSVITDSRIGLSGAAWRSVRYSQIDADDKGNVYVFSGTTENKAGALRINKGTTAFDSNYYFDILAKSNGHYFRRLYHITGDYFLVEFYNEAGVPGNQTQASKYGVVNVTAQTVQWVTGLPDVSSFSAAWATTWNGKIILPITPTTGQSTVYLIDPVSASAKLVLTLAEGDTITAITHINE